MKGSESFLSGRFNDPYGRPGDSFRIRETPGRESWHVCNRPSENTTELRERMLIVCRFQSKTTYSLAKKLPLLVF